MQLRFCCVLILLPINDVCRFIDPEATTIYDAYKYGSTLSEGGPCLGWRNTQLVPYQWLTYNETMLRGKNFGAGMLSLGLRSGENTRIGILSRYLYYY